MSQSDWPSRDFRAEIEQFKRRGGRPRRLPPQPTPIREDPIEPRVSDIHGGWIPPHNPLKEQS